MGDCLRSMDEIGYYLNNKDEMNYYLNKKDCDLIKLHEYGHNYEIG